MLLDIKRKNLSLLAWWNLPTLLDSPGVPRLGHVPQIMVFFFLVKVDHMANRLSYLEECTVEKHQFDQMESKVFIAV